MTEYQHLLTALVTISSIQLRINVQCFFGSDSRSQADGQKLPLNSTFFLIF
jgi:hypothetical protein